MNRAHFRTNVSSGAVQINLLFWQINAVVSVSFYLTDKKCCFDIMPSYS